MGAAGAVRGRGRVSARVGARGGGRRRPGRSGGRVGRGVVSGRGRVGRRGGRVVAAATVTLVGEFPGGVEDALVEGSQRLEKTLGEIKTAVAGAAGTLKKMG